MEYWNKIDLHQHTNHDIDCNGTFINGNYSHKDYYKWLEIQKVNLKAVTCHNNIDIAEHVKQAIISDMLNINHLVGVEIDYHFNNAKFHAITILSPNVDVIKFSETLREIRAEKGKNIYFNEDDFVKLHTETEFIFIPHAIKEKGIFEKAIGNLDSKTIDWVTKALISGISEPVLFENTREYHIYSLANKIQKTLNRDDVTIEDIPAYVGSDYKFDDDEERKKKAMEKPQYSIFSQATYRGLEIAVRNHKSRLSLNDQIIHRDKYISRIVVNGNDSFKSATLDLSPGLNVIIGDSGTGKTLLLNQIYYQLKHKSLKASLKDSKAKEDENTYKTRVGNNDLLKIELNHNYKYEDIKILEIPNIYSEILRTQEDGSTLPNMFGIDNVTNSNQIILDYKNVISNYSDVLSKIGVYLNNGKENIVNISSAIEFLVKNKSTKNLFNLEVKVFDETELNKVLLTIESLNSYIEKKDNIKNYFIRLKTLLLPEDRGLVDDLINKYIQVIEKLLQRRRTLSITKNKIYFDKKITDLINKNISNSISLLGAKEKALSDRKTTLANETTNLINNVKKLIIQEINEKRFNLSYPYDELKKEIEKNCNDYARISLNDDLFNIKNVDLLNNPLFNVQNLRTKLKQLDIDNVDFTNSDNVKKVISKLNSHDIKISGMINEVTDLPQNVEIFLSEKNEWRLIQNTNKGDIAKKSIEYYFNKLVKDNQPNIILIDQPENDVDKTFITTTLSKFIMEQKSDKQIIVTSHDAIVAINSDVNKIIEASIDDKNYFNYVSYDLEYVRDKVLEATNRVSKILDGGKENIKKRYQIYGGELNYENISI